MCASSYSSIAPIATVDTAAIATVDIASYSYMLIHKIDTDLISYKFLSRYSNQKRCTHAVILINAIGHNTYIYMNFNHCTALYSIVFVIVAIAIYI